jgi:hypothetical protein
LLNPLPGLTLVLDEKTFLPRKTAYAMKVTIFLTTLMLCSQAAGCATSAPWAPLRTSYEEPTETTLVWVGRGECERLEEGQWVRHPEFDYEFAVEQRRSGTHWESTKSLRRLHPNYDGSAGERTQTFFFAVDYDAATPQGSVAGSVRSTLGSGTVSTDREFRKAKVELRAEVSSFAPFDRYRITQSYRYETGQLEELVELNQGEAPWVRNHERATLFAEARFASPPTTLPAPTARTRAPLPTPLPAAYARRGP